MAIVSMVHAHAATISPKGTRHDGIQLHLEGKIVEGDAERLEANFEHAKSLGLAVNAISLDSPGGRVSVGASLARSVRARQLKTIVADGDTCASSCFMLFAAGKERSAGETSRIGVHSAVVPMIGETDSAKSSTVDTVRFLSELGVPPQILGKMVTATPDQMAWLNKDDLRLMQASGHVTKAPAKSYVETATPPIKRESLPPIASPADATSARDLLAEAMSSIRANAPKNAVKLLKRAKELDPYDPFIASTYGYALHLSGDNAAAKDALLLSLQIKKDFAEAYRVLALTAVALNDAPWARANFVSYYKTSTRPDAAYNYLQSLKNDTKTPTGVAVAVRAALSDLRLN